MEKQEKQEKLNSNLRSVAKKVTFLLIAALVEFADYLLLFTFPIVVFDKIKSFWLTMAIIIILPLAKGISYLLIRRIFKRTDTRFLYLFGFTLIFAMIIVLNRQFTVLMLPLLLLLWGAGLETVKMSLSGIRQKYFNEYLGNWDFLQKPVQTFAVLAAPVFAFNIYTKSGAADIFNFLGFIMAVAALLFFFGLNKPEPKALLQAKPGKLDVPDKKRINKSILFVNLFSGILWLQLPLQIIINQKGSATWSWLLPLYLLPYLLLAVLKNVFRIRIWQLHSRVKYLILGLLLVACYFATDVTILAVVLILIGFVNALIYLADQHERLAFELDADYVFSQVAGFVLAALVCLMLGSFLSLQQQFTLLGIAVLGYGAFRLISSKARPFKVKI